MLFVRTGYSRFTVVIVANGQSSSTGQGDVGLAMLLYIYIIYTAGLFPVVGVEKNTCIILVHTPVTNK